MHRWYNEDEMPVKNQKAHSKVFPYITDQQVEEIQAYLENHVQGFIAWGHLKVGNPEQHGKREV